MPRIFLMDGRKILVEGLKGFATLADLRASPFHREHGPEIERFLNTPQIFACPDARPRIRAFVRAVQWNIEKGRQFEQIFSTLKNHQILRWADVVLLNEADFGMCRSGNRHVARDLAQELGMHLAFGAAHVELTKGTGDDLQLPGENQESLQGNAILSRYPMLEARVCLLPVCFEPYHFHEKRYGRRICVWARMQIGARPWWVGSAHLEVRDTPGCRARQFQYLTAHLPGGSDEDPYLVGGDLNSSGFGRGTRWRTLASVWRLTAGSAEKVKRELLCPDLGKEPLFRVARAAGFHWEDLNSSEDTAWASLDALEDAAMLPDLVRRAIRKRLERYNHFLRFKLDWFLGRGVRGLREEEAVDRETGVSSSAPGRVLQDLRGAARISDHSPIHVDLSIESTDEHSAA